MSPRLYQYTCSLYSGVHVSLRLRRTYLGSTLQKGDTLIIEKGNRLDAAQLSRAKI
jgi:hypothetical protein